MKRFITITATVIGTMFVMGMLKKMLFASIKHNTRQSRLYEELGEALDRRNAKSELFIAGPRPPYRHDFVGGPWMSIDD